MLPLLSQCTKRVLGQGRFSFPCPAAELDGVFCDEPVQQELDDLQKGFDGIPRFPGNEI